MKLWIKCNKCGNQACAHSRIGNLSFSGQCGACGSFDTKMVTGGAKPSWFDDSAPILPSPRP